MNLTDLGRKNWTEKVSHGYLDIYEELWKDLQDKPITLLEIGVYNGNSIKTWLDWFPNATIVGIDKHPASHVHDISSANLHYGDQADETFLKEVASKYTGFDIIIDDGGHHWKEQQVSFETLWDHVDSGGMYIIEDLHTSNDRFWSKGWATSTVDYLKDQVDAVVYGNTAITDIKSIEFFNKLAVIKKV